MSTNQDFKHTAAGLPSHGSQRISEAELFGQDLSCTCRYVLGCAPFDKTSRCPSCMRTSASGSSNSPGGISLRGSHLHQSNPLAGESHAESHAQGIQDSTSTLDVPHGGPNPVSSGSSEADPGLTVGTSRPSAPLSLPIQGQMTLPRSPVAPKCYEETAAPDPICQAPSIAPYMKSRMARPSSTATETWVAKAFNSPPKQVLDIPCVTDKLNSLSTLNAELPSDSTEHGSVMDERRPGDGTSPPQGATAAIPLHSSTATGSSPSRAGSASLRTDIPGRSSHPGYSSLQGDEVVVATVPSSGDPPLRPSPSKDGFDRDAGSSVIPTTVQAASNFLDPDVPLPSIEPSTPHIANVVAATRPDFRYYHSPEHMSPLGPTTTESWSYNPRFLTTPTASAHRTMQPRVDGDRDPSEPPASDLPSPSTGPSTPMPNVGMRLPDGTYDTDYFSDTSTQQEEDNSREASPSLALIRNPRSGCPSVIWPWEITDKNALNMQISTWIATVMARDLLKGEEVDGYIYAFKADEQEKLAGSNYVKIGVTGDFKARLAKHPKCYGNITRVYPPDGKSFVRAKHAKRVEVLIHAELVNHGMFLKACPKLPMAHQGKHWEWYNAEVEHAIKVIEKWTNWMNSSPYVKTPVVEKKQFPTKFKLSPSLSPSPSPSPRPGKKAGPKTQSAKKPKPKVKPTERWALATLDKTTFVEMCWPVDPLPLTPNPDTLAPGSKPINEGENWQEEDRSADDDHGWIELNIPSLRVSGISLRVEKQFGTETDKDDKTLYQYWAEESAKFSS